MSSRTNLDLGWIMTEDNHPTAWLEDSFPDLGDQLNRKGVFSVPVETIENHSLLFAQSGSGKSFFVGRLIEELLLKSDPRIIAIDPNSDYANFAYPEPRAFEPLKYNIFTGVGNLPTDTDYEGFTATWRNLRLHKLHQDMQIPLHELEPDLFVRTNPSDDVVKVRPTYNYMVHLFSYVQSTWGITSKHLGVAGAHFGPDGIRIAFERYIQSIDPGFPKLHQVFGSYGSASEFTPPGTSVLLEGERLREQLMSMEKLVDLDLLRRIMIEVCESQGIFTVPKDPIQPFDGSGLYLIDKTALPQAFQFTLLNYWLKKIWDLHEHQYRANLIPRPTIIFIDEAHHLLPREIGADWHRLVVREQLRKIAAEGRKYGLYLFVISQRPDKLDSLIVSECQNKIVMRVGSLSALEEAGPVLGLTKQQVYDLSDAVKFRIGRAFVMGPMAEKSTHPPRSSVSATKFYTATRRTKEGSKKVATEWRNQGLRDSQTESMDKKGSSND